ncbi:hypothetical protein [Adlercreutzia sp. ZJ304]|uniref:hypothetical protein n=1 Tax=Adlercreutzia sp. ZJ304 TaxID=2709791 RepID=UPI0013ECC828|nr:hypothetical protein [Adlercreutzia sp. ZJ304]
MNTTRAVADVDYDAKKAAVSKVQDCFDMDFDMEDELAPTALPTPGLSFTVEQLEAMLVQAKTRQATATE